jgi:recombinational DNA repair protein RecT
MTDQPKFEIAVALKAWAPRLEPLCKHSKIDWPGFAIAAQSACMRDAKLMEAAARNPNGLLLALTLPARLGLMPDPQLHHFALVPFQGVITPIIEYRGLLHLMLQTGQFQEIRTEIVYEGEQGDPWIDNATGWPNHKMDPFTRDTKPDNKIIGSYCAALIRGRARPQVITLSVKNIRKRAGSAINRDTYKEHFPAMCLKAAIRAMGQSGLVPLGQHGAQRADLHLAMTSEDEIAAKLEGRESITIADAKVVAPEIADDGLPTEWNAADKENFKQLESDPLPDDAKRQVNLVEQIKAFAKEKKLAPSVLATCIKGAAGRAAQLKDLTIPELENVLDVVMAPE